MAWYQEETVPSTKASLPLKFQESEEADLIKINIFLTGNQNLKNNNIIRKLVAWIDYRAIIGQHVYQFT